MEGIFLEPSETQHIHVHLRSFRPDSLDKASPVLGIYVNKLDQDADALLRDLQDDMIPALLKSAKSTTSLTQHHLSFLKGGIKVDEHATYLAYFLDRACDAVLGSLDDLERRSAVQAYPLLDEVRLHLEFALVRADRFSIPDRAQRLWPR